MLLHCASHARVCQPSRWRGLPDLPARHIRHRGLGSALICKTASGGPSDAAEHAGLGNTPGPVEHATPASSSTVAERTSSPEPTIRSDSPAEAAQFEESPVPDAGERGSAAAEESMGPTYPIIRSDASQTSRSSSPALDGVQATNSSPEPVQVESHELRELEGEQRGEDFFAAEELIEELKQDFGSKGEVWFFVSLALTVLLVLCPVRLQGLIDMLGTLSLTTGIVSALYGVLSLGRNLSPMPQPRKQHQLITTGMFSYVRHPMYGGVLMAALGLVCLSRSETRLAITLLLWWVLDTKVHVEEQWLLQRYPQQYERYRAAVPKKFIPFLL